MYRRIGHVLKKLLSHGSLRGELGLDFRHAIFEGFDDGSLLATSNT